MQLIAAGVPRFGLIASKQAGFDWTLAKGDYPKCPERKSPDPTEPVHSLPSVLTTPLVVVCRFLRRSSNELLDDA